MAEQAAKDHIAFVTEFNSSADGWTVVHSKDGVEGSKKPLAGSPIETYKAVGIVNCAPKQAAEKLWAMGPKEWKEYDSACTDWQMKEEISPTLRVIEQVNSLPWPLWSRDMLMLQILHSDDAANKYCVLLTSKGTDDQKFPCDTSKFVRAVVNISAYIFEPASDPTKAKLTRIVNVDPSGNIPTAVVNAQASSVFSCVDDLNRVVFK